MKKLIIWSNKFSINDLIIFPSADKRRLIEKILDTLSNNKIDPNDLLYIAQYDIRSKRLRSTRELKRVLRRISKAIDYKYEGLEKETSGTTLFTALTYYSLHDLLEKYNLRLIFEPRVISKRTRETISFDYGLVGTSGAEGKAILIVEVKRLWSLGNLPNYIDDFSEKLYRIPLTTHSRFTGLVIFHLHFTRDLIDQYNDCINGIHSMLNLFYRFVEPRDLPIYIVTTNGTDFDKFKNRLVEQINYIVKNLGKTNQLH